ALKKDPKLPGLRFQLAEMLGASPVDSDRKEAEQEYRQALEENPLDIRAECRLGEIALNRSDMQDAERESGDGEGADGRRADREDGAVSETLDCDRAV
ncbi:MAG TPA: hypothetical protein VG345_13300, partial [Bryobacteraceae bacterium]|nr:hypothetical protein [Bryobacteraceae bacterium]